MEFSHRQCLEWDELGTVCRLRYNAYEISFFRNGEPVFELAFEDARRLASALAHAYGIKALKGTVEGVENAGQPWTRTLDSECLAMWAERQTLEEIARHFQRTTGAIRSRLRKLGVEI